MPDDKLALSLTPVQNLPALPLTADFYRPNPAWESEPAEPAGAPLSHYFWILKRHRYKIISFVLAAVAATWVVSSRMTPVYESTTKIDVDVQMPANIVGQESTRSAMPDSDQFLSTQVNLIQSDSVLRPVAQQFKLLDTEEGALPNGDSSTLGLEAPVGLKDLKVVRPANTYLLLISYRSADRRLAADVANAVARSYIDHTYDLRIKASTQLAAFMEKQLEELKVKMERSGAALAQFERELNVINPEEKTNILSARLLQLNTDYTKAESERIAKESAWRSVRSGTYEAAAVSTQGEEMKKLAEKVNEAEQKFADVQTRFGENHPEFRRTSAQLAEAQRELQAAREGVAKRVEVGYREAVNREGMLQKSVVETKAEFDRVNARSFEYQSRKREAEGDKKLYEELMNKIKEAGINAGFQNSNIRIADNARPARFPVFPKLKLNLALAFLLSTLLAVGAAVLSDTLDSTVRDPDQVKSLLRMDVLGGLPEMKPWLGRTGGTALIPERAEGKALVPTKVAEAASSFQEAISTLRNSILLGSLGQELKTLMITSALPSEGKTTTAVHLAMAHAQQKKTLLIDCDFRRPSVHQKLGLKPEEGLASALQNGMEWRKKLITIESVPNLDILPTGTVGRRSRDLIGGAIRQILDDASATYELVIIDSPPVLGFPEPLQIAVSVDGVVLVARAGQTNQKALRSVLNTMQRLRVNVLGLVLNGVKKEMTDSYHYHSYYGNYYSHYRAQEEST